MSAVTAEDPSPGTDRSTTDISSDRLAQKGESVKRFSVSEPVEESGKQHVNVEGLKPDSVEGRYVADMGKAVYKLQELFAEALVDASENYQSSLTPGEELAQPAGTGAKFSMRDIKIDRVFIEYGDTAAEQAAIDNTLASLVNAGKVVKINPDNVKKHGSEGKWTDWKAAREYLKGILEKYVGSSVYFTHNKQYAEAYLTRAGIDHSAGGTITAERAEIFDQFKGLVRNAEYAFSSKNDVHSNSNKKIGGRIDWDCFVAVAMIGKELYPVVFKIRTIDRDVRSQIHEMSIKKRLMAPTTPASRMNCWAECRLTE